ncbi:GTPase Era [Mycoplasmopsis gallopavonis]|uniref:GTPase Era n=1 Tax=Mycoplasmopsis gallopavonis TaxID=76629 RepID=A0A449AZY1_9BACT|nr:GTPase Era [Mycoplasmopsis gallopavonis]RIV16621.1 GTPase Era [Mycoplasmopsis gallopavonis]VEU73057.1 GTP-binding protein [Mycoplasmopsis gallopavonis]
MKICFATILGRPNVGKSSLLNAIVGYNVAIVTPTAQTTRDQITGIYTENEYQIIFSDTPGIHKPLNKLGEALNKNAYDSIKNIDVILFLTPADELIGKGDEMILEKIKNIPHKIAVVSKIDKIKSNPSFLEEKLRELEKYNFEHIVSTDVNNFSSIQALIDLLKTYTYPGEAQYDVDYVTDKSMRFLAKEIIRESAINRLYQELPHSIAVEVTDFIEDPEHLEINAIIYVKKSSQKGMVIGKGAQMIKNIGIDARKKISHQFDIPTILNLKVKVANKWIDDEETLSKFGYRN